MTSLPFSHIIIGDKKYAVTKGPFKTKSRKNQHGIEVKLVMMAAKRETSAYWGKFTMAWPVKVSLYTRVAFVRK
jgi:hypothetical protein